MKKFFLSLAAMLMSVSAFAFEFDGINLNDDAYKVTKAISAKNYVNDFGKDRLKGMCQGTEIYLSFNLKDVTTKNKIGQLFVDIPEHDPSAFSTSSILLNVIYHQIEKTETGILYAVDEDGTTLLLEKTDEGIRLTYNTPYYKKK